MRLDWQKGLFVLIFIGSMAAVLGGVAALIPDESVPRIVPRHDGTTEYCLQSLEQAVLVPLGWGLGLTLMVGYAVFCVRTEFRRRVLPDRDYSCIGTAIAWLVVATFVFVLIAGSFRALIIEPAFRFRTVIVGPRDVTCVALYRSWTILRSNIRAASVVHQQDRGREKRRPA